MALLKRLTDATAVLERPPDDVDDFVSKLAFLGELAAAQDEIQAEYDTVADMYKHIETYTDDVGDLEHYASFLSLPRALDRMQQQISYLSARRSEQIEEHAALLDAEISKLRLEIMDMRRFVQDKVGSGGLRCFLFFFFFFFFFFCLGVFGVRWRCRVCFP